MGIRIFEVEGFVDYPVSLPHFIEKKMRSGTVKSLSSIYQRNKGQEMNPSLS